MPEFWAQFREFNEHPPVQVFLEMIATAWCGYKPREKRIGTLHDLIDDITALGGSFNGNR